MGNDGGSFQARSDLVKEKAKEIKIDNAIIAKFKARLCTLSKSRLKKPISMCRLGNLYNFEEVLRHLMEKSMPQSQAHIKKTKDVCKVKMVPNPDQKSEFPFICPLSLIEFNGLNHFVGLWSCGCVFSSKLVPSKEQAKNCPVCNAEFSSKDLISLNLSSEEADSKRAEILTGISKKVKFVAEDIEKKEKKKEGEKKEEVEPTLVKKLKVNENPAPIIGTHKLALIEQLTETQKESESNRINNQI